MSKQTGHAGRAGRAVRGRRNFNRGFVERLEGRRLLTFGQLFEQVIITEGVNNAVSPIVVDLNQDGWDDIAYANNSDGTIGLLINRGDGSFRSGGLFSTGATASGSLVSGDFNGDGLVDLASRSRIGATVSWLAGNGDGTFGPPVVMPAPTDVHRLSSGDLDGDGRADLLATTLSGGRAVIYWGKAGGGFDAFSSWRSFQSSALAHDIADLNGDDIDDILVSASGISGFSGSASRQLSPMAIGELAWEGGLFDLADLDGDGDLDVYVRGFDYGAGYLNDGSGRFVFLGDQFVDQLPMSAAPLLADMDADGDVDLVYTGSTYQWPPAFVGAFVRLNHDGALWRSNEPMTIRAAVGARTGFLDVTSRASALGDFNRDGLPDVVMATTLEPNFNSPGALYIGLNTDAWAHTQAINVPQSLSRTLLVDVDGDDRAEIVQRIGNQLQVRKYTGTSTLSLLTDIGLPGSFPSTQSTDLDLIDLNGDGLLDVYGPAESAKPTHALLNLGNGTAWQSIDLPTTSSTRAAFAYVDGDAVADLVRIGASGVDWLPGNGDGTFGAPISIAPNSTGTLLTGDVNGDGRVDVVLTGTTSLLFVQQGSGWASPVALPMSLPSRPYSILTDVDRDGLPDLLWVHNGQLRTHLNRSGTFSPTPDLQNPSSSPLSPFNPVDLNLDGLPDVLADNVVLINKGKDGFDRLATRDLYTRMSNAADVNGDGVADFVTGFFNQSFGDATLRLSLSSADRVAPVHYTAQFSIDAAQRVTIGFLERLDTTLDLTRVTATQRSTGRVFTAAQASLDLTQRRASFDFDLPDGEYDFDLLPGAVRDLSGKPNPRQARLLLDDTFILAADANRDRRVDFADLLIVAQNYGQTGKTFSQGNFDYSPDGLVGFSDLLILAQRYGTNLIRVDPKATTFAARTTTRRSPLDADEAALI